MPIKPKNAVKVKLSSQTKINQLFWKASLHQLILLYPLVNLIHNALFTLSQPAYISQLLCKPPQILLFSIVTDLINVISVCTDACSVLRPGELLLLSCLSIAFPCSHMEGQEVSVRSLCFGLFHKGTWGEILSTLQNNLQQQDHVRKAQINFTRFWPPRHY